MDFNKAFGVVSNAVVVEHEGGAKFHLLPKGHEDAWATLRRKMPLKKLEAMQAYYAALSKNADVKASQFFETGEDMLSLELEILSSHVKGWETVEQDGKPLPYTHETAKALLGQFEPFAKWVDAEITRLAGEKTQADEVQEDIKKK